MVIERFDVSCESGAILDDLIVYCCYPPVLFVIMGVLYL